MENINTAPNVNNDEVEINLIELLYVLLEHWKGILASVVLLAATVFLFTYFFITKQYASTSILYVMSKSTSITSFADIQIGSSLTTDYMEVVGGRPVLDQVIEDLKLDMDYKALKEKLSFANPSDSRMLKITATDADPKLAKKIADSVARISSSYIAQKMDQDPPSIIQNGYIEEEAVSPRLRRNTVLAGAAGGFLAILIVVINYLMNDTVLTPEDLETKLGLQVIGTIPMDENEAGAAKKNRKHDKKKVKKVRRSRRKI